MLKLRVANRGDVATDGAQESGDINGGKKRAAGDDGGEGQVGTVVVIDGAEKIGNWEEAL